MSISPAIAGVVLAAGASSRMGQDKALLPWQDTTFLGAQIQALSLHCDMVLVVAGTNADAVKSEVFSRGAFLVVNHHPETGQFSSLRCGLHEVLNRGRDAAFIALVDRPPASAETLHKLAERFRELGWEPERKWAVVPSAVDPAVMAERHGHPILINREMIEALLLAPDASNAREVTHHFSSRIEYLRVKDPAVIANINTPDEYEHLRGAQE